ncbi:J domain-containing protein [bacterium]|nr:J domain-containing protein [bacterium]
MTTLKAKCFVLLSLLCGRAVGAIAFCLPLAIGLWSIELALYWTAAAVLVSLVPMLRSVTFLGIISGLGVVWWEFIRAFIVAFLEPHTIVDYLGLTVAFLVTAFILIYCAIFSFGMMILGEDVVDEPEVEPIDEAQTHFEEESPPDPFNPYHVLEIEKDASPEEIRKKYREMIQQYHPDKVQHLGSALQSVAREKTIELKQAFEMLSTTP